MRQLKRQIAFLFYGLFFCTTILYGTTVTVNSSKQLLVNGQPFTVKGVNYSPTPVGYTGAGGTPPTDCLGQYFWWTDRPTYIADFPLIHRMGANTIRTFNMMNSATTAAQVRQALDVAQANGLYVIMGYFVSHTVDLSNAGVRAQALSEFLTAVNAYKNHPAVLMWAFGNENNLDNGNTDPTDWYSLIQLVAQQAKAADPFHVITTVEGECLGPDCAPPRSFLNNIGKLSIGADDTALSFLDIWSINAYRGATFEGVFQALDFSTMTVKPILVTEFGKDAWRDSAAAEDQDMQANTYINPQWKEINANLSATGVGTATLIGGSVFEWSDEWWKDPSDSCSTHGTPALFHRTDDAFDPNYQDEWFGITSVAPIDPKTNSRGSTRTFRKAYFTLQSFWSPGATSAATAAPSNFFSDTVHNYPNPFRVGSVPTKFVALVNDAGTITASLYDASGQFVSSLPPVTTTGPGRYELLWDGKNRQGEYVSSGLYFARIEGKGALHSDHQFRRVVAVK